MRVAPTICTLALLACGDSTGCTLDTHVIDVEYGGVFEQVQRNLVTSWERLGYDCRSAGALRTAFGGVIGLTYVCTKCS